MAHWIEHEHLFAPKRFECSQCGAEFDAPYLNCPSCGALMTSTDYSPDFVDECEILGIFSD